MMKAAFVSAMLVTAVFGFRSKNEREHGDKISIECSLEFVSAALDPGDEVASRSDEEYAECTTADEETYELSADDLAGFQAGDVVSMSVVPTGKRTVTGEPLWKATAIQLKRRPEVVSLAESHGQATGVNFLILRASYTDAEPEWSVEQIHAYLQSAFVFMRNASYGKFPPADVNVSYKTVHIDESWEDIVESGTSASRVRSAIYRKAPEEDFYTHRLVIVPNKPKIFSAWAYANNGCSHPSKSPTFGKCYTMYRQIGGQIMAHELGHNFGLHHAPSSIKEDLNSKGEMHMYGDDRNLMGYSGNKPGRHYVAPSRYFLGWLPSSEVKIATSGYYKLSNLQNTQLYSRRRNNQVVIRIPCASCEPLLPLNKPISEQRGGDIWVAYSEGKIAVHLFKNSPPSRTEAWARMTTSSFDQRFGGTVVRFCKKVGGNQAYVGISNTSVGALAECQKADAYPLD